MSIEQVWILSGQPANALIAMSYLPRLILPLLGGYSIDVRGDDVGDEWAIEQAVELGPFTVRITDARLTQRSFRRSNVDLTTAEVTLNYVLVPQALDTTRLRSLWFTATPNEFPPFDSYGGNTTIVRTIGTPVPAGQQPDLSVRPLDGTFIGEVLISDPVQLSVVIP